MASNLMPDLPLFAGGKSFGGRMTSQAQAKAALPQIRGLIFLGFPLHPANKPSQERAAHLAQVGCPMLFLQGTRDELADVELIRTVTEQLGERGDAAVVRRRRSFVPCACTQRANRSSKCSTQCSMRSSPGSRRVDFFLRGAFRQHPRRGVVAGAGFAANGLVDTGRR